MLMLMLLMMKLQQQQQQKFSYVFTLFYLSYSYRLTMRFLCEQRPKGFSLKKNNKFKLNIIVYSPSLSIFIVIVTRLHSNETRPVESGIYSFILL